MKVTRVDGADHNWGDRSGWACVVRYGGIGDIVQASSVFPLIKKQGYKLAVNTDDGGLELLKHNPYVDELIVQKQGQIPHEELDDYWARAEKAFERYINLTGSIETSLLLHPSSKEYWLSKSERHGLTNVNYLEKTHDVSGVEHKFDAVFHSTKSERAWARKQRKKMGLHNKVVLWSLSGSSIHKAYPYVDEVVKELLEETLEVVVVFTGDYVCEILEFGWENTKRVHCTSGKWPIRKSLAFIEQADCIVGTETGLLNAAGLLQVPKVILLSHSTKENLTKHWKNTVALTPKNVSCYPCHRLHYDLRQNGEHGRPIAPSWKKTCNPHHLGGAVCAHAITPKEVKTAIYEALKI